MTHCNITFLESCERLLLPNLQADASSAFPCVWQGQVQNGDFSSGFTNWTPVGLNNAVVPATINDYTAPAGAVNAAQLGTSLFGGSLSQTLATQTGSCYKLTFYMISQAATINFFSVSYAGVPLTVSATGNPAVTLPGNNGAYGGPVYLQFTTTVTGASAADVLTFNFRKGLNSNFYLTGISLVPCAKVVCHRLVS